MKISFVLICFLFAFRTKEANMVNSNNRMLTTRLLHLPQLWPAPCSFFIRKHLRPDYIVKTQHIYRFQISGTHCMNFECCPRPGHFWLSVNNPWCHDLSFIIFVFFWTFYDSSSFWSIFRKDKCVCDSSAVLWRRRNQKSVTESASDWVWHCH